MSNLFDSKYEELAGVIDPTLPSYDKLMFLNQELFYMIETSVDIHLLASLYSSQLVTKDKKRFYYTWITEIIEDGIQKGEFASTSTTSELVKIYAMFERALIYDWVLCKGKYSLSEYSQKLLQPVLERFKIGFEQE